MRFSALLTARGCPVEQAEFLGRHLLASLAEHGTKVVLGLPEGDVVITAEEARQVVGRDLRSETA